MTSTITMTPAVYLGKGIKVTEEDVYVNNNLIFKVSPNAEFLYTSATSMPDTKVPKVGVAGIYTFPKVEKLIINDETFQTTSLIDEEKGVLKIPSKFQEESLVTVEIACSGNVGINRAVKKGSNCNLGLGGEPVELILVNVPPTLKTLQLAGNYNIDVEDDDVELPTLHDMSSMFAYSNDVSLRLQKKLRFDGAYAIDCMFYYTNTENIVLAGTGEITSAQYVFAYSYTKTFDLTKFAVSLNSYASAWFMYAQGIDQDTLDLNAIDVSGVLFMGELDTSNQYVGTGMFANLGYFTGTRLNTLDISGWNLKVVNNVSGFLRNVKIGHVKLPSFEGNTGLSDISKMFYGFTGTIDLLDFGEGATETIKLCTSAFEDSKLGEDYDTEQKLHFPNAYRVDKMFYNANWGMLEKVDADSMFKEGQQFKNMDYTFATPTIAEFTLTKAITVESNVLKSTFCGSSLKSIDLSSVNFVEGTVTPYLYQTFQGCPYLETVITPKKDNAIIRAFDLFGRFTSGGAYYMTGSESELFKGTVYLKTLFGEMGIDLNKLTLASKLVYSDTTATLLLGSMFVVGITDVDGTGVTFDNLESISALVVLRNTYVGGKWYDVTTLKRIQNITVTNPDCVVYPTALQSSGHTNTCILASNGDTDAVSTPAKDNGLRTVALVQNINLAFPVSLSDVIGLSKYNLYGVEQDLADGKDVPTPPAYTDLNQTIRNIKLPKCTDVRYGFSHLTCLTEFSDINLNFTDLTGLFLGCRRLSEAVLSDVELIEVCDNWCYKATGLSTIHLDNTKLPTASIKLMCDEFVRLNPEQELTVKVSSLSKTTSLKYDNITFVVE